MERGEDDAEELAEVWATKEKRRKEILFVQIDT